MAWMSEEAAATVLGVSFKTIRRRVGNGSIRAMRQGRQILVDIEIGRITGPKQPSQSVRSANTLADTGSTNVATLDTRKSEQASIAPSTHALPISPLTKKTLRSPAISSTSTTSSPRPMLSTSISSAELPGRQWSWLAIWLLLTLLLTTGAVSAWIYHQGQVRMLEAESRYQQAMLEAQQAQEKHARIISRANQREREIVGELSATNAKLNEAAQKLAEQQDAIVSLKDNLDKTTAALAATQSERKAIANKLASAQTTAQLMRWQTALSDSFGRFAELMPRPKQSWRAASGHSRPIPLQPVDVNDFECTQTTPAATEPPTTTLANVQTSAENGTLNDTANANRETDKNGVYYRPLPHQPATLSQEDTRAALRAIIKSEQSENNDNSDNRTGIVPEPN